MPPESNQISPSVNSDAKPGKTVIEQSALTPSDVEPAPLGSEPASVATQNPKHDMHSDIGHRTSDLDQHLVEFARLLRDLGIRVSASEIQDAMQGLVLVGLADKERVEAILQATMVKEPKQIPWFKEAFRAFFATPEQKRAWESAAAEKSASWQEKIGQSRQELRFQERELNLPEEDLAVYAQMSEEDQQRLRDFLDRSSQGMKSGIPVDHSFQPVVEKVVRGSLDYWRRKLGEEDDLLMPPGRGDDGITSEVERALREQEIRFLAKDLKNISPEEWPQVVKLIRRLSQRLASQISRHYRAARRRGGVDIRRTVRANLRYGGVLIERRFRSRHSGRPRFVLLCDLSGSMLKYTEFVLQFVYGLASVVQGIETFAFADRLTYLTPQIRKGQSFQEMVTAALPATGKQWGSGTNLAKSLAELLSEYAGKLSKRTVMIVVSDTQTLEPEQAATHLREVRRQVREILWLNTLPARRWSEAKGVELFQPLCQMYECYTLGHLHHILSKRL